SFHPQELYAEKRSVRCTTLDDQFTLTNESIALKIDIEGHELKALQGSEALLSNNRCIIQIEIYEPDGHIEQWLERLGYRSVFVIGPDHYFSNIEMFFEPQTVLDTVALAMAATRSGPSPSFPRKASVKTKCTPGSAT
ncbi:MAG: FkbM family methyltransferase, partial [Oxalobacteraceae bacterium]